MLQNRTLDAPPIFRLPRFLHSPWSRPQPIEDIGEGLAENVGLVSPSLQSLDCYVSCFSRALQVYDADVILSGPNVRFLAQSVLIRNVAALTPLVLKLYQHPFPTTPTSSHFEHLLQLEFSLVIRRHTQHARSSFFVLPTSMSSLWESPRPSGQTRRSTGLIFVRFEWKRKHSKTPTALLPDSSPSQWNTSRRSASSIS